MYEFEQLVDMVTDRIVAQLSVANRLDTIDELLKKWGLNDICVNAYENNHDGKIVVLGDSRIKMKDLEKAIKQLGLNKDRFEFHLDYDKAQRFNYKKYECNSNYSLILVGALPHSTHDKGDFNSPIEMLKNTPGYPRVEVLSTCNEVKITKSNFKEMLENLIATKYISCA